MTENERLLQFLYLAPVGLVEAGSDGTLIQLNPLANQILAQTSSRERYTNIFDALSDVVPGLRSMVSGTNRTGLLVDQLQFVLAPNLQDDFRVFSISVHRTSIDRLVFVLNDVTRLVAQEREIHQREAELLSIIETVREHMIVSLDAAGRVRTHNATIERLSGLDASVVGKSLTTFFAEPPDESLLLTRANSNGWTQHSGPMVHESGDPWWGTSVISRIVDSSEATLGYSMIVRNDTDRHRKELQLQDWATRDELTGMLNRRAFRHRAGVEIENAQRSDAPLSFCLLDIDHFKAINDTWGHEMGDAVLRDLGQVLDNAVRTPDVTVRMGGEEFGVLMPDTNVDAAQIAAERIRTVVSETRFTTPDGTVVPVTASLGIARLEPPEESFDSLYRRADKALCRAKNGGRNRVEQ